PRGVRHHRGRRDPRARAGGAACPGGAVTLAPHLPALQVVVPLLAAPLAVLLRHRTPAFVAALVAAWATFAVSVALAVRVSEVGAISYALGGWAPPWGIEYRVDALSAVLLLLVSGMAALVLPYARASIESEI